MYDGMTVKEINRLIEWFVDRGYTLEEAAECIKYIALGK